MVLKMKILRIVTRIRAISKENNKISMLEIGVNISNKYPDAEKIVIKDKIIVGFNTPPASDTSIRPLPNKINSTVIEPTTISVIK